MINPTKSAMFRTLQIASSGLSAQRQRLETIASNIANAETTRTENGAPYRRRVTQLEVQRYDPLQTDASVEALYELASGSGDAAEAAHGVRVAAVVEDTAEGPLVYDPGHPDADANGYVRYPNVRVTDEMVALMDARRVYEANATVFQSAKQMLRRSLDI